MAIVSKLDEEKIYSMREALADLHGVSMYVLDRDDLRTIHKAMFLQLVHSEKLYGDFEYSLPSKEEVREFVNFWRRERLDDIRHYLILPHSQEKINSVLYPFLKRASLYLSCLVYAETGILPKTRKELLAYLERTKSNNLWINMMKTLDDWDSCKSKYFENPLPLLLQIETFYRTLRL